MNTIYHALDCDGCDHPSHECDGSHAVLDSGPLADVGGRRHAYRFDPSSADIPSRTPCLDCGRLPGSLSHVASCGRCFQKPAEYRSEVGHLTLDPKTGATVLEGHAQDFGAPRGIGYASGPGCYRANS